MRGIEEAPVLRIAAAARSAVQEEDGLPVGVSALLDVELVQRRGFEHFVLERFDLGKEVGHGPQSSGRGARAH